MKTAFKQITIIGCEEKNNLEKRGLFGFHNFENCPNCVKRDNGFRVHAGDSIFAPFVGYYPDKDTTISPNPVYYRE